MHRSRYFFRLYAFCCVLHKLIIVWVGFDLKISVTVLLEYCWGKGTKQFSSLDFIHHGLYVFIARICKYGSVAQSSWAKLSSAVNNTHNEVFAQYVYYFINICYVACIVACEHVIYLDWCLCECKSSP